MVTWLLSTAFNGSLYILIKAVSTPWWCFRHEFWYNRRRLLTFCPKQLPFVLLLVSTPIVRHLNVLSPYTFPSLIFSILYSHLKFAPSPPAYSLSLSCLRGGWPERKAHHYLKAHPPAAQDGCSDSYMQLWLHRAHRALKQSLHRGFFSQGGGLPKRKPATT